MNNFLFNVKKHLKTIIFLFVTALLCFTFPLLDGIFSSKSSSDVFADFQDEVVKKLDEEIMDSYMVGDSVEFPSSIEIPDGDDTITATFGEIIMPNSDCSTDAEILLEQLGSYTVRYYFQKGGIIDFAEKQVLVGNKLATITGAEGSITPVTSKEQVGKVYENLASNTTIAGEDALIVRLQEGGVFKYSKSIDLTKTDENGYIDIISLNYHLRDVIRNETGFELTGRSANFASIKLTDSYDPSIYVEFAAGVRGNDAAQTPSNSVMLAVKPYCQNKYTSAVTNWKDYLTESHWQKKYVDSTGYAWSMYSLGVPSVAVGAIDMRDHEQTPVTWKYNPETQIVYASINKDGGEPQDRFIHDMTMNNIGNMLNTEFNGFPSGKAILTITTFEWAGTSEARFDIFSIGGVSGKELVEEYNSGYYVDEVATPIIDLGVDYTVDNKLFIANGSEFTLPKPVEILGGIGNNNYSVNAYVNYGASAQYEVPIYDGKIAINKPVIYTIKYSAIGKNGAVGEQLLQLVSKDVEESLAFSTDESFFGGSFESGQTITLPEYNIATINNPESVKVKIKLVHENYTRDININTRDFVLEYSGEHKIVYEYSDNVFNLSKEYVFDVSSSDNVGFVDKLVLPKYFIKNASYSLPNLKGYTLFGSEHTEQDVSVSISYDNGENWTPVSRENVQITGDDTVLVKYSCGTGDNETSLISSPSKIVDVGYGGNGEGDFKMREYFIHDGFNIDAYDYDLDNYELKYSSKITSGNNTLEFINAIDYAKFDFRFKLYGNINYKKVNISLIDYADPTIKYVLSYTDVGGIGYVSFNGESPLNTTRPFETLDSKAWTYNKEKNIMVFDGVTKVIDLSTYFTSLRCYLQIELVNINGEADFIVDAVNEQYFTNDTTEDLGFPRISNKDFSGYYALNDIVTITAPNVTDVLSPILDENVKVRVVRLSDGQVMTDINGLKLNNVPGIADYQFRVDELGEYSVYYTFTDGAGMLVTKIYSVMVVDTEKPVITFNKVAFTEITIEPGTTIDASFTVTDKVSVKENITTSLIVRDYNYNTLYSIHDDNSLIHFNITGKFIVYAFAQDEAGNYTYNSFIVNVKNSEVE